MRLMGLTGLSRVVGAERAVVVGGGRGVAMKDVRGIHLIGSLLRGIKVLKRDNNGPDFSVHSWTITKLTWTN